MSWEAKDPHAGLTNPERGSGLEGSGIAACGKSSKTRGDIKAEPPKQLILALSTSDLRGLNQSCRNAD